MSGAVDPEALVFDTTEKLVDWMQDEYLSLLLLRSMKPRPTSKPPPRETSFEWGLSGVEEGKLMPYVIHAEGVRTWSLDGEWDKTVEVSFEPDARGDAPVVLVQLVPGRLTLECDRVQVEKLPAKRYRPPPRPRDDDFLVWGESGLSWNELLGFIDPPRSLDLYQQGTDRVPHCRVALEDRDTTISGPLYQMFRLQEAVEVERPWLFVSWMVGMSSTGHYFSVSRGTIDDDSWARVRRLPGLLGPCTVMSGSVRCSGDEWVKKWCGVP